MPSKKLTGPDHCPAGYEWLPHAFARSAGRSRDQDRERIRSALAEGEIEAILRTPLGHRNIVPQRMWDKDRLDRKVYPRFRDGRMRMGLNEFSGPYVEGWIFVPVGSIDRVLKEGTPKASSAARFSPEKVRKWYRDYVSRHDGRGIRPSREDDLSAARAEFGVNVSRPFMRELRRDLAPDSWKRPGRLKSGKK